MIVAAFILTLNSKHYEFSSVSNECLNLMLMDKKIFILVMATVILVFSSCQKEMIENDHQPDVVTKDAPAQLGTGYNETVLNFRAHLSGREEVPSNNSRATGQAIFQLSNDGSELSYKLIVANLFNVTQAHIHIAQAGENGPVVAWLYPAAFPSILIPGRSSGILMEGVITTSSLVGMLSEGELSDLIDLMVAGKAYVNVHTLQFPPGEIRGQISGNVKD
jgi:hypothetical protein